MSATRFHSLDAFRFFAFLKVFLLHLPIASGAFPLFERLKGGGQYGVLFFFVLSGFLITYLLLLEKLQTGRIGFKTFFLKRTLRIWPVFFVTVGLVYAIPDGWLARAGFFTIKGYEPEWAYSFTFLENYKMILEGLPPRVETLWVNWSVCIEQHFYLLWPLVVALMPVARLPLVMIVIVLVASVCRGLSIAWWPDSAIYLRFKDLLTNMDLLALGGLVAWFIVYRGVALKQVMDRIPRPMKSVYVVLVVTCFSLSGFLPEDANVWFFAFPFFGLLFAGLLLIVVGEDSPIRIKDSAAVSFLGRISYGLYMYHLFVILIVAKILKSYGIVPTTTAELAVYTGLTLLLCIVVAWVSWRWLEMPLLQLKRKLY